MQTRWIGGIWALATAFQFAAAAELLTPPTLWKDYDPNQGDFKEEVVSSGTKDGIFNRESYISAYVLGEEVRVYCKYSVKAGAVQAPGVLNVHGWMGAPNVTRTFVENGWAAMAHDYCGKTGDRKHYTYYLSSLAPEAYVPYITAATLWLNGSNDHHGGHERSLESFKRFKPGVPWAFAIQARGHHNTEKIDQACAMWLDKHVLGKDVFWTEQPQAEIRLDAKGIPELVVRPTAAERVKKVEIYYALKEPCSFNRSWRDAACAKNGNRWTGKMPVLNVDDYVFGYANVTYDTTLVLSTAFCAAIPAKLGAAKATDKRSSVIYTGDDGRGVWTAVAEVEGPRGIKGFRCTNHRAGTGTEQLSDPKWKAPAAARLGFKFYCTQPQTLILTANSYDSGEIEITASDDWQEMVIPAHKLINRFSNKPMKDWTTVGTNLADPELVASAIPLTHLANDPERKET